ncbi:hypothetical protein ETAE_1315 [Edwardsiella piscicida]|uniref:Uncharacterized protein n=1 Tax=Edwardsiella piscicida TaxID=1263550 RepID=A0AAU8P3S1_EDWPI|nr:hypothetical protein ETAE_1315 [Edwardsiella tarda EIB202]
MLYRGLRYAMPIAGALLCFPYLRGGVIKVAIRIITNCIFVFALRISAAGFIGVRAE